MTKLSNIEFFTDPRGNVMIADGEGVHTFTQEDVKLTGEMFARIEEEYPEAFKALNEASAKARANVLYYRYLCVSRFIRCNFGIYDSRADIGADGAFKLEEVQCPMRCECKYAGIICNAKRSTRLTQRQQEVMRLMCEGTPRDEIAEQLYISVETVKTTKRNAFAKVGAHSMAEFMRLTQIVYE